MDDDLIRRGDAMKRLRGYLHGEDDLLCWDVEQIMYDIPRADLAQAPAPVRVKDLVWDDFGGLGAKASAYYQANYLIQFWKSQGQFEVALSFPGYQTGYDGERWHPTLKAAKAAAQADYAARILAALEAPDAGVVAELVEALRLADAALSGANMNMKVVEKRVKAALALIAHNTTEG